MTRSEMQALYDGLVAVYRAAEQTVQNHHLRVVHKHAAEIKAYLDGIDEPHMAADAAAVMDTQAKARAADGSWMAPLNNPDGAWLGDVRKTLPAAPPLTPPPYRGDPDGVALTPFPPEAPSDGVVEETR